MQKHFIWIIGGILILGGAGATLLMRAPSPNNTYDQSAVPGVAEHVQQDILHYQGKEGESALALLKARAMVEMTGEGENAFVTSINGRKADDAKHEYWSFWVNGEMAQVGAGSYITHDTDNIEWRIATY